MQLTFEDPYENEESKKNPYYDYAEAKAARFATYGQQNRQVQKRIAANTPEEKHYSTLQPRIYGYAPTALGGRNDERISQAADQILSIYSSVGTGNNVTAEQDLVTDLIISQAFNIPLSQARKKHDLYIQSLVGADMTSKDFLQAFSDAWKTDYVGTQIATWQNRFDRTKDEDEKQMLLRKIEKAEKKQIKLGDYTDRGQVGNAIIQSAPILNQMTKSIAISAATAGLGAWGTASSLATAGTAKGAASKIAFKAFMGGLAGRGTTGTVASALKAGAALNMLDTYNRERGSFSRELYNMVDENGNRIPDNVRNMASDGYALLSTVIEFCTPEPSMDAWIKGRTGAERVAKTEIGRTIKNHFVTSLMKESLVGASGESLEEGLQSAWSDIVKDIASMYSDSTGVTHFGKKTVWQVLYDAWSDGVEAFTQAFGPSLIAGLPGNILSTRSRVAVHRELSGYYNTQNQAKAQTASKTAQATQSQKQYTDSNATANSNASDNANQATSQEDSKHEENRKAKIKESQEFIEKNVKPRVEVSDKDPDTIRQSAEQFQKPDMNATPMDIEQISLKSEKPTKDYAEEGKDGKPAEKLGTIDVMPDPNVTNGYIGVTEADNDKLKWLANKGVEGVLVNGHNNLGEEKLTNSDLYTQLGNFGAVKQGDTIYFQSENDRSLFISDNSNFFKDNADGTFSYIDSKGKEQKVRLNVATEDMKPTISKEGKRISALIQKKIGNTDIVSSQGADFLGELLASIPGWSKRNIAGSDIIISDKESGYVLAKKGALGAIEEGSLRMILSPNATTVTIVHEGFHLQLRLNPDARKNLKKAFRQTLNNSRQKSQLERVINENISMFHGRSFENIMETLENMDIESDALPENEDEVMTDLHSVWGRTTWGKYLPENIKKIFNQLASEISRIYSTITGKAMLPTTLDKAYSKFYERYGQEKKLEEEIANGQQVFDFMNEDSNVNANKQVQEEKLVYEGRSYTKDQLIDNFTNKEFVDANYDTDTIEPRVHIYRTRAGHRPDDKALGIKSSSQQKKNYQKEIRQARAFASKFDVDVYILPDELDDKYGVITLGKNPDSIVKRAFVDFKQLIDGNTYRAIQHEVQNANRQHIDIVYINADGEIEKGLFFRAINGTVKKEQRKNPQAYNGMAFVVSKDVSLFEIYQVSSKKQGIERIDSRRLHEILEASSAKGYQNNSDTQNVTSDTQTVNPEDGRTHTLERLAGIEDDPEYQKAIANEDWDTATELVRKRMEELNIARGGYADWSEARTSWHGTSAEIEEFDSKHFGSANGLREGVGIYSADGQEVPTNYATKSGTKGFKLSDLTEEQRQYYESQYDDVMWQKQRLDEDVEIYAKDKEYLGTIEDSLPDIAELIYNEIQNYSSPFDIDSSKGLWNPIGAITGIDIKAVEHDTDESFFDDSRNDEPEYHISVRLTSELDGDSRTVLNLSLEENEWNDEDSILGAVVKAYRKRVDDNFFELSTAEEHQASFNRRSNTVRTIAVHEGKDIESTARLYNIVGPNGPFLYMDQNASDALIDRVYDSLVESGKLNGMTRDEFIDSYLSPVGPLVKKKNQSSVEARAKDITGRDLYWAVAQVLGGDAERASRFLDENGIAIGNRYGTPDSAYYWQDTGNTVFYNPERDVFILRKLVLEKLLSSDMLSGLNRRLSDYTPDEVALLIDNGIYVPDAILNSLRWDQVNATIKQELADRKKIYNPYGFSFEVGLNTKENREIANGSATLDAFLKAVEEKYYEGNDMPEEARRLYSKFYLYSKVKLPSEMRAQFISEHQTLDSLLALKAVLTKRKIFTKSKDGKISSRYFIPKTTNTYRLIAGISENSTQEEIDAVLSSIKNNTDMWIKDYIRARRDYEKLNAMTVGSKAWLEATAQIGYLSYSDFQFAFAESLRLASGARKGWERRKEMETYGVNLSERTSVEKAMAEQGIADVDDSDISFAQEYIESAKSVEKEERDAIVDNYNSRINQIEEEYNAKIEALKKKLSDKNEDDELILKSEKSKIKAETRNKLDEVRDSYRQAIAQRDAKAEETRKAQKEDLENKRKLDVSQAKFDGREAVKNKENEMNIKFTFIKDAIEKRYQKRIDSRQKKIDALTQEIKDRRDSYKEDRSNLIAKYELEIIELKEKRDKKIEELRELRKQTIERLEAERKEAVRAVRMKYALAKLFDNAERKATNYLKTHLNVNLGSYDYSLVEATGYIYSAMHDYKRKTGYAIETGDYESNRTVKGTVDGTDGIITFYRMEVDEDGNIVPVEMELQMGEEMYDRSDIPQSLRQYLPKAAQEELADTSLSWARISVSTKMALATALELARADAKKSMEAKKAKQYEERNQSAKEVVADAIGGDIELSDADLEQIAKDMGEDWKSIKDNPELLADFRRKAERYFRKQRGYVSPKEITPLKKAWNKFMQGFASFPRVAKMLGDNIYKNFVLKPQQALDNKAREIARRNKAMDDYITNTLFAGDKKAKMEWLNGSYSVASENTDGTPTPLTGWNLIGAYMYAFNIHGFIKLISRTGNNIAIEEMARINPKATLRFIDEELRQRESFYKEEAIRMVNAQQDNREYKPGTLSTALKGYDKARLESIKASIESAMMKNLAENKDPYISSLPNYATALGDKIIELLGLETVRMEQTAYNDLNAPFKMQEFYVPMFGRDSAHRDAMINNMKGSNSRVFKGMIADRQMVNDYALLLEPLTVYRRAVNEQETFINMTKTVNDLNFLMEDYGGNMKNILREQYGDTIANMFSKQIEILAGNEARADQFESLANRIVANASTSAIAFNLMTIPKNFLSLLITATDGEVSFADLGRALREYNKNRKHWQAMYNEYAPDVANSTFSFDYQMLKDSNTPDGKGQAIRKLNEAGLKGVEWADQYAKRLAWISSFLKSKELGMSDQDAAVKATQLVKRTQSVSNAEVLAPLQRSKNPWVRGVFAFTKDTFQVWNAVSLGAFQDFKNKRVLEGIEKIAGVALSAGALALLKGGWLPDKDDDELDWKEGLADFFAQIVEYAVPIQGLSVKEGMDGWGSSLVTTPAEVGKLLKMPFTKTDYDVLDYLDQLVDVFTSGASAAGLPMTGLRRVKNSFYKDGEWHVDPGYLLNNNIGDANWLELTDWGL